jgi:hypothetical protein
MGEGALSGFGLLELVVTGCGGCVLLVALLIGLAIVVKLVSMIRSLIGKLALVGCYLLIVFGCCLLLLIGAVLFVSAPLGGG